MRLGISQSLTGAPASWASDTGGIDPRSPQTNTNSPTKTVFVRAQFSALSSGLEVGGAGLNQDPVGSYDATTINRFRNAVILTNHPLHLRAGTRGGRAGLPAMRGVGFNTLRIKARGRRIRSSCSAQLAGGACYRDIGRGRRAAGNPTNVAVYLRSATGSTSTRIGDPGPEVLRALDDAG